MSDKDEHSDYWLLTESKFKSIKKRLDGYVFWRKVGDNIEIRIDKLAPWNSYVKHTLNL